ncbi:MAG: hypothetical protein OEV44_03920 [Spirochaetota bacterium]|nr:hypothetical protein [Spirochaetota bacterium]
MLVIISDLHLSDCSAGNHNVPETVFADWLNDILDLASHNTATELIFLYLGDIFDLIRTEYWFYDPPNNGLPTDPKNESFKLDDRPWGKRNINNNPDDITDNCRKRANIILDLIFKACNNQIAFLSGNLDKLSSDFKQNNEELVNTIQNKVNKLKINITRIYIPGNHDRLFLIDKNIENKILTALNATKQKVNEKHFYKNTDYGVVARHGHEWDVWNFEGFNKKQHINSINPALFKLTPIGDLITTELASKLPYQLYLNLQGKINNATLKTIYDHIQNIENVRPLYAAIKWILHQSQDPKAIANETIIKDELSNTISQVMDFFMNIPFVDHWIDKHDQWNIGFDEADTLQNANRILNFVSLNRIEQVIKLIDKYENVDSNDKYLKGAMIEKLLVDDIESERINYCIYGHTHSFNHVPIGIFKDGSEKIYFNSGTWRPVIYETYNKQGFIDVKEMTYLVFYNKNEDLFKNRINKGLSYETWSGKMLKRVR